METIDNFVNKLKSTKNLSEKTISAYVSDIKLYCESLGKLPENADINDIYGYIADKRQKRTRKAFAC